MFSGEFLPPVSLTSFSLNNGFDRVRFVRRLARGIIGLVMFRSPPRQAQSQAKDIIFFLFDNGNLISAEFSWRDTDKTWFFFFFFLFFFFFAFTIGWVSEEPTYLLQVTKDDCPVIFHDNFIFTQEKVGDFYMILGSIYMTLEIMLQKI